MTVPRGPFGSIDSTVGPGDGDGTFGRTVRSSVDPATRRLSWAYRIVAVSVIVPIVLSAVLAAHGGWIPTNDAAAVVLRAKYSLGSSPDLLGLYAWPSSAAIGVSTFSPGPWQLWWMALPIDLLGTTWGPLLSMAVLNSVFVLVAGWAVRRRLGDGSGIAALGFFALLIWSFGADAFASPVPVVAVVAPLAAYCFVAWALAAGDDDLLPVFAGLASFLTLGFPETTLIVPFLGVATLTLWFIGLRKRRALDVGAWPSLEGRVFRRLGAAVLVTFVIWLPPVIQEITSGHGNLGNLYQAQGEMPRWMSGPTSVGALFSLFARYPFWLRGSTEHSFLTFNGPMPSAPAIVGAVAGVGAALVAAVIVSHRRGDHAASTAVVLAVWAMVAAWLHLVRSPHGQYFLPIWPIMMFVTFALVYTGTRALPASLVARAPIVAVSAALVVMVATLPDRPIPHFTATSPAQVRISRAMNASVVTAVRDRGTVSVEAASSATYPYVAALAVALDDARVPMCADHVVSFSGYDNPACDRPVPGVVVTYRPDATSTRVPSGETIIARYDPLTSTERAEWERLSRMLRSGIDRLVTTGSPLPVADRYRDLLPDEWVVSADGAASVRFVDDPRLLVTDFDAQTVFADAVVSVDAASHGREALVRLQGMSDADLLRWVELRRKLADGIVVTARPSVPR